MPIKALLLKDEKTHDEQTLTFDEHRAIKIIGSSISVVEAKAKIKIHPAEVVFINVPVSESDYYQMKNKCEYQTIYHSELMIEAVTKALQIIE
jgi:hypothetical protein